MESTDKCYTCGEQTGRCSSHPARECKKGCSKCPFHFCKWAKQCKVRVNTPKVR